ncbi:MAG TPA: hypothetical protein VF235_04640 [Actinomycetota bacterium]
MTPARQMSPTRTFGASNASSTGTAFQTSRSTKTANATQGTTIGRIAIAPPSSIPTYWSVTSPTTTVIAILPTSPNVVALPFVRLVATVGRSDPTTPPSCNGARGVNARAGSRHRTHHRTSPGSGAPHARQFLGAGIREASASGFAG